MTFSKEAVDIVAVSVTFWQAAAVHDDDILHGWNYLGGR